MLQHIQTNISQKYIKNISKYIYIYIYPRYTRKIHNGLARPRPGPSPGPRVHFWYIVLCMLCNIFVYMFGLFYHIVYVWSILSHYGQCCAACGPLHPTPSRHAGYITATASVATAPGEARAHASQVLTSTDSTNGTGNM